MFWDQVMIDLKHFVKKLKNDKAHRYFLIAIRIL